MRMWIAIVLSTAALSAQAAPDLRTALVNRVDVAKRSVGMVVGVLTPDGRTFTTYGRVSADGSEPSADTFLEVGSITKVFTALMLADMVERGEVTMDDPAQ
jgi:D-alanyl-D-alanine-carboxypeptidase/D-alanyl-D-alanine-endopeptidase